MIWAGQLRRREAFTPVTLITHMSYNYLATEPNVEHLIQELLRMGRINIAPPEVGRSRRSTLIQYVVNYRNVHVRRSYIDQAPYRGEAQAALSGDEVEDMDDDDEAAADEESVEPGPPENFPGKTEEEEKKIDPDFKRESEVCFVTFLLRFLLTPLFPHFRRNST